MFLNQTKHSGLKRAQVDQYSPLGWVKDLSTLAKEGESLRFRPDAQEGFEPTI